MSEKTGTATAAGDLGRILVQALRTYPDEVNVAAVNNWTRGRRARPDARKNAYLEIEVEDELVLNQRGDSAQRDLLVFVRIPRAVVERLSRLVIPG